MVKAKGPRHMDGGPLRRRRPGEVISTGDTGAKLLFARPLDSFDGEAAMADTSPEQIKMSGERDRRGRTEPPERRRQDAFVVILRWIRERR
jgi:hypothetical protein